MPWSFSKWDWGALLQLLAPLVFAVGFGVLLALMGGALVIHLLLDVFLG